MTSANEESEGKQSKKDEEEAALKIEHHDNDYSKETKRSKNNNKKETMKVPKPKTKGQKTICQTCGRWFESKNSLFLEHLIPNTDKCLSPQEHEYVVAKHRSKLEKVAILYGYQPALKYRSCIGEGYQNDPSSDGTKNCLSIKTSQVHFCLDAKSCREAAKMTKEKEEQEQEQEQELADIPCEVTGGETAAKILMEAIRLLDEPKPSQYMSNKSNSESKTSNVDTTMENLDKNSKRSSGSNGIVKVEPYNDVSTKKYFNIPDVKTNRSYGCLCRNTAIVAQEDFTPAVTEVLTIRTSALIVPQSPSVNNNNNDNSNQNLDENDRADSTNEQLNHDEDEYRSDNQKMFPHHDRRKKRKKKKNVVGNDEENRLKQQQNAASEEATDRWIDQLNKLLKQLLGDSTEKGIIQVFGRLTVPKAFNAEEDVTSRRMEYVLPIDLFSDLFMTHYQKCPPSSSITATATAENEKDVQATPPSVQEICDMFPSFEVGHAFKMRPPQCVLNLLYDLKKLMQCLSTSVSSKQEEKRIGSTVDDDDDTPGETMQKQTNGNGDGDGEIEPSQLESQHEHNEQPSDEAEQLESITNPRSETLSSKQSKSKPSKKSPPKNTKKKDDTSVPRRRSYHNFTPNVMAHEYLAYRRLDRFHHRCTTRFVNDPNSISSDDGDDNTPVNHNGRSSSSFNGRPFITLSLTGDMFLTGQIQGMVGLLIAICKGLIDRDIIDCIFDEHYPTLVPAPVAPYIGLYAQSASYMLWEGRMKAILTARHIDAKQQESWKGFRSTELLTKVSSWEHYIKQTIAQTWMEDGVDERTGRLLSDIHWTEHILKPWAIQANEHLKDYRSWKILQQERRFKRAGICQTNNNSNINDTNVPELYQKTLRLLREADSTGKWPTTSIKRQLVMVSTSKHEENTTQTMIDHEQKKNSSTSLRSKEARSMGGSRGGENNDNEAGSGPNLSPFGTAPSPYSYEEGQGGASGSFSVGIMPGDGACEQPRGNVMFPELTKAAFELERALMPHRTPSSTIAINRNAQFRPHIDSGAGAGQSTSLIVGLGSYRGGELVVEGTKHNICYKPLEFNGWTQRHWTLPFEGERYSLVWFTPHGCEGKRGIDLSLP